jgi:hypothetical protein
MRCSPSSQANLPWPLFSKMGTTMGCEELRTRLRKIPLFKRGIKGDFQSTLMTTVRVRLSNQ